MLKVNLDTRAEAGMLARTNAPRVDCASAYKDKIS